MTTETQTPIAVPTRQEVNALVLTACFGWRWESTICKPSGDCLTAIHAGPDDPFGYVPSNYYAPDWSPSDADAPRFTDWDKANIWHDPNRIAARFTLPDFCGDRNLVAERLLPLVSERGLMSDLGIAFDDMLTRPVITYTNWGHEVTNWSALVEVLELTPAQQTEAVLRTLGHWPADWQSVGSGESP